jgi:hypothetical protein
MDKTVLVVRDLANGTEILDALDRANLGIRVAIWAYLNEYPDWRLVLASPRFDQSDDLRDAFGLVNDALEAAGIPEEKQPSIIILKMSDKTIRDLRKMYAKWKGVEGRNIGNQLYGDRFIEEAIAYRVK